MANLDKSGKRDGTDGRRQERLLRAMPLCWAVFFALCAILTSALAARCRAIDGFGLVGIIGSAASAVLCVVIYAKQDGGPGRGPEN